MMAMMATVFLLQALAQASSCTAEARGLITTAIERAAMFDLAGAGQRLQVAAMSGCRDALLPSMYLRGWIGARDAYRVGGSPEALRPVLQSIAMMQDTFGNTGTPQIAQLVLKAAAAASQSERDELGLMIEYAVQLEDRQLTAGLPALPLITAHEAAGDLWLQVHRYDDARRAYEKATERIGVTPRITLGLARVAARVDAVATACTQYRKLVASWEGAGVQTPEIAEARMFLANPACQSSPTPRK
jgi:hypothetical protein